MPDTFQYKVRNREGKLATGSLIADNESLVLARLREQGFTPLEVKKQSARGSGVNIQLTKKKIKLKELAIFSRQFATMVNSGLPILRSLAILSEQNDNPTFTKVLDGSPTRRRAGRGALGGDGQASEAIRRPLHLDGALGGDRRIPR